MWIRLTVDDDLCIQAVETASDATPYAPCTDVAENFKTLAGLRIAPGWIRQVKSRVGGVKGCTHLRELMTVLATVSFQTIYPLREKELMAASDRRPPMLNTCIAWGASGPIVKEQYPAWYSDE